MKGRVHSPTSEVANKTPEAKRGNKENKFIIALDAMDVADLKSIHDAKRSKKESDFLYALDAVHFDDNVVHDSQSVGTVEKGLNDGWHSQSNNENEI